LYNTDPLNKERSLSGVGSNKVIGDSFKDMIESYILRHKDDSEFDKVTKEIIEQRVFEGYLRLIKERGVLEGQVYNDYVDLMREAFRNNQISFFAQTMVGISVKDGQSPYNRDYAFMSMHDATDWYLWIRQTARPTDSKLQSLSANREYEAVVHGGASTSAMKVIPIYRDNGNLPNTFRTYARDYYAKTLKPVSEKLPLSSDATVNPFGGWGYQPWGYGIEHDPQEANNKPAMNVQLQVEVMGSDGEPTGETFKKNVNGWSEENNRFLSEIIETDDYYIKGSMEVEHDGVVYELVDDNDTKFKLIDKADGENINKSKLLVSENGVDGTIPIPSGSNQNVWEVVLGYDTPSPSKLNKYLGGARVLDTDLNTENKYEGKTDEDGQPIFSNAKLTLYVQAVKETKDSDGNASEKVVPQWRVSKYWDAVSSDLQEATAKVDLPSRTFDSPRLNPSNNLYFDVENEDSNVSWAYSEPKFMDGRGIASFSPYNTSETFNVAGDLLAIKEHQKLSNLQLANWINPKGLYEGKIPSGSMGIEERQDTISKSHTFRYGVDSGLDDLRYSELRRRKDDYHDTKYGGHWHYEDYRWYGDADFQYSDVEYPTNVMFNNYRATDSEKPKTFKEKRSKENGFYWETVETDETIQVNPEVPMAYDDKNGNTSLTFVAGSKLREVQPIAYHAAKYVGVNVEPSVSPMSVATDYKAKQLANKKGQPNKPVVYKGSSIVTSFETDGNLELKTYALDIGASALKSKWNPSSTYSTDSINDDFLSRYARKNETSDKWEVSLKAESKLKIGGQEYGGQSKKLIADQVSTNVKEHTLEIRGGKLVSVDGNSNLETLPGVLKGALQNMHILGDENIFNAFEQNGGEKLTEQTFADMSKAVRGSDDIAVGKGWYSEDSTILVVREYTNTFKLPSLQTTDKVPMEIPGLQAPINKNLFFSKGERGHSVLRYKIKGAEMTYDSSLAKPFGGDKNVGYIVGNASILDTFQ